MFYGICWIIRYKYTIFYFWTFYLFLLGCGTGNVQFFKYSIIIQMAMISKMLKYVLLITCIFTVCISIQFSKSIIEKMEHMYSQWLRISTLDTLNKYIRQECSSTSQ